MGRIVFGLLLILLGLPTSYAQQASKPRMDSEVSLFDSLNHLEIEHVILTTDLDTLFSNKFSDKQNPGLITITLKDSRQLIFPTKVSVRGKFRRIKCSFPPVRLNFRKKDLRAKRLDGKRDKYKLVTHCQSDGDGESAVLREYLVYQMYQLLTDQSYRTILFPIVYKDVDSDHQISSMAFLIENTKQLTHRLGGTANKGLNPDPAEIDPFLFEQMALFQYMVGNRDMTLKILRNILLVSKKESEKMIPIAYDFDMSPFVNASYAYPQYKDKRDVERIYLGIQENALYLVDVIQVFRKKKDEFYRLIEYFKPLSAAARKECINYLEAFYAQIEDRNFAIRYPDN